MPKGVDATVENGFATIEFVDQSLRGPGLAALFAAGTQPELVEKVTRPRVAYIVPEGNARAAGLLDEAIEAPADGTWTELVSTDTGGPYTILPEIENPDGTTPLDAIIGTVEIPAGVPVPDPVFAEGGPLPDGSWPVLGTSGEDVLPKQWPDGEPEIEWKRPELDAYARSKGIDPTELPNKDAVLAAIEAKAAE